MPLIEKLAPEKQLGTPICLNEEWLGLWRNVYKEICPVCCAQYGCGAPNNRVDKRNRDASQWSPLVG